MNINQKEFDVNRLRYVIRSAKVEDGKSLAKVRLQIDGETENMDRKPGEAYIDELGFRQLIQEDTISKSNLFLVAEVNGKIAGFSRCEGNSLKRTAHKVEFGIAVLKEFWGHGIGKNLLQQSIDWADNNGIKKISLSVLETNEKAIILYKKYGFEVEGRLKNDKFLSDGKFYDTLVMGRLV
ncbi:ribosomal protein S18 acetylase RimI-like enzyme [Salirhabdus euzebyi]|uniref:Ribosomal protein S18 acetylase RimI-like enzyme n=1 Tax=Salirhabdus euzebyi TaxID=394506 RepID=A0A841PTR5_9BACI|nr:GNAT family N-acetyltransferase [Salirhabdus euzebyi]MBB6452377.1 ribosomal protein S18 acetylase RimI-like enzyme [Salirhabdus euzebyi]